MEGPPEECGIKQARSKQKILSSVILGYATYFQPKFKICQHLTKLCTCESVVYLEKVCVRLFYPGVIFTQKIKDQSHNVHSRISVEITSRIFETYENAARLHGCHIHNTASDMVMLTMCTFPFPHNELPHLKCMLCRYDKLTSILIPG